MSLILLCLFFSFFIDGPIPLIPGMECVTRISLTKAPDVNEL